MSFKITVDHVWELGDPFDSAIDTYGPGNIPQRDINALNKGEGTKFKMYDDDGILYYEGLYLGDPNSEDAFEPLDCFGTPNAGAVRIDYRIGGKYQTL